MNSGGGFFNLRFPSLEVTSRPEIVTFIIYVISYMLLMVVCQESVIRESGIRPEISPPKERLRGLAPNHEIGNIRSLILSFLSFQSQTSRPKLTIYVITWSVSEWERFCHHMIYVMGELAKIFYCRHWSLPSVNLGHDQDTRWPS